MSAGEVVGLSLTVALFAFLSGVLVTTARDRKRSRAASDRDSRLTMLSRFLSARRAVTRASLTFVASMRAFGSTKDNSPHAQLRAKEARSSRRRLQDALSDLDRAEADLTVWFPDMKRIGENRCGVDVATLRAAIEGTDSDVATLAKCLHEADRLATVRVRECATTLHRFPQHSSAGDVVKTMRSMLERFGRQ